MRVERIGEVGGNYLDYKLVYPMVNSLVVNIVKCTWEWNKCFFFNGNTFKCFQEFSYLSY